MPDFIEMNKELEKKEKAINIHNTESSIPNTEAKLVDTNQIQKPIRDALGTHRFVSSLYVLLTVISLIMNCEGFMFGLAVAGWQVVIGIILMPILIVGFCIFASKHFIIQGNTRLGNIILFSPPILACLYLIYLVKGNW